VRECRGEQPGWVRAYAGGWSCHANWCAIFVWNAYRSAGVDLGRIAYTEDILDRARRGEGLQAIPAGDVRRGDLVLMYTYVKKGRRVTHAGLATGPLSGGAIPTVEGNTGDPDAVVTRRRSLTTRVGGRALVQMVVRVP
jgi:cell wall-associated NlpC family hydrolase